MPVAPLEPLPEADAALVALGEALFYDPVLSGNKDVSCASCHHPAFATGDGLSLSVGTGATGIGPDRANPGYPGFIGKRLVKHIAESHGGTARVISPVTDEGRGSSFQLDLPLRPPGTKRDA